MTLVSTTCTLWCENGSPGGMLIFVLRCHLVRYAVKTISKRFLGSYLEPHFVARIQHEVS
jgi:hypothetical protein